MRPYSLQVDANTSEKKDVVHHVHWITGQPPLIALFGVGSSPSCISHVISSQAQPLSHRIDLLPIADSFGILEENISFIDQDKDTIPLTNDVELKHFFEHFDQVSGGIKFVVQDLQAPDRESAFN